METSLKISIPLILVGACFGALSLSAQAHAAYPEKPIRVIVPFGAGGVTDALLRLLQEPVGRSLGQPVLIENKPGAAGAIAARYVAESAPDGYTLLVVNTGLVAITPFAQRKAGFDPIKSFAPVAGLSSAPSVLLVHPSVPVDNVSQFVAYAKANPGKIDYAVVGKGAYGDLATALFSRQAGIRMTPVPYQGNAQTTTALITGEVKAQLTILSGAMNEYIRGGKIKALGVATAAPTPLVPGVAPIAETVPDFDAVVFTGLLAPARTPPAIVQKVSQAVTSALADPALKAKLVGMGMEAAPLAGAAYGERIANEVKSFAPLVKDLAAE
jgi:tripartite-type tricarboxylate transporter receptor subunit TctC